MPQTRYGSHIVGQKKLLKEHERAKKAAEFYKLVGDLNKRDDAEKEKVESHIKYLTSLMAWEKEKDCDDPHIFALVFEKPVDYVLTSDQDIANCRKCMNEVVDNRYCQFRLISSEANYKLHKSKIFS